ncbi:neuronal acetylcholine receptor subunit alpha-9 [Anabrus simplex]|uniref:neuronal acetylcholine receptor subunit alpha-9 n=1 Tax=Anabrus simplex TaxID=316456 RepID=UPI0035A3B6E6
MDIIGVFNLCSIFLFSVVSGDPECTPLTYHEAAAQKLRKYLFCNYDKETTPIKNQSTSLVVDVELNLDDVRFNEAWYTLELHCYVSWIWFDEFLQWKESDYDGIDRIIVDEQSIWVPNILVYSAAMGSNPSSLGTSMVCDVRSNGEVTCFAPTLFKTHCVPDLTHWPFDTHSCNLTLSSWVNDGELSVVNFSSVVWNTLAVHMPVLEWKLLNVSYSLNATQEYGILIEQNCYTFVIQRRSMGYAATVVVSAVVIAALTLSMFWVDPSGGERILIGGCSVLAHCLYLVYLGWILHPSAKTCPLIVQFYRDSLLLTTGALIVAVLARRLAVEPPSSKYPKERMCLSWLFQVLKLPSKLGEKRKSYDDTPGKCEGRAGLSSSDGRELVPHEFLLPLDLQTRGMRI